MDGQIRKPDILIFLSDQHTPLYTKPWGGPADAPNIQRLIDNGVQFTQAYTSCPLCVPARMSMLSGLLPSDTGVLTNDAALPDMTPTFLHALAAGGYETVLVGRMHFIGPNQRHGFTKRLLGDITPTTFSRPEAALKAERGFFSNTFEMPGSIDITGGGSSPVLAYDEKVIAEALRYMDESHEKPQCIVVGTYAPHFPYVAPIKLYEKYKALVKLPPHFNSDKNELAPPIRKRHRQVAPDKCLSALASYCGMIENMDRQLGTIYAKFMEFSKKRRTKHLFCYLSDHGDQVGERGLYGKFTFFEKSAKIPLILCGDAIPSGLSCNLPVSIMDIGPTLCEYANIPLTIYQRGLSLMPYMNRSAPKDRIVIGEIAEPCKDAFSYGRMYRYDRYKYITYHGCETFDMLFDIEADPEEAENLAAQRHDIIQFLKSNADKTMKPAPQIEKEQTAYKQNYDLMTAYEKMTGPMNDERCSIKPAAPWPKPQR